MAQEHYMLHRQLMTADGKLHVCLITENRQHSRELWQHQACAESVVSSLIFPQSVHANTHQIIHQVI